MAYLLLNFVIVEILVLTWRAGVFIVGDGNRGSLEYKAIQLCRRETKHKGQA